MVNLPDFSFIEFDAEHHKYFNTKVQRTVPSVTSVLGKVQKPFDEQFWLAKKAREEGISPAELKAKWDAKRAGAAAKGTRFHSYMENRILGKEVEDHYPVAETYLDRFTKDQSVVCEMIVGNDFLAGTFDNLVLRDGKLVLKDWKTNEGFSVQSKYPLQDPFTYLDDSKLTIYSLQMSIYRHLLDLPIWKMEIVHFTDEGFTVYDAPYLEREARMILKKLEYDYSTTCGSYTGLDQSVF